MSKATLKFCLLMLMLALSVGVATAQDAPSGEITFIFWESSPESRAGWESHVARFNETFPDITVNLIGVPGEAWSEYLNGTATLIAGGEQPDIIWVATEGVRFLVGLDLMLPLDDIVAEAGGDLQEYFDDMAPNMVDSMRVDGQLYFFPYSWNTMLVYYNQEMFDAAGLEYPSDDWTRDEFLATAQALTADRDGDGNNDQYGFEGSWRGIFRTVPWMLANGSNIVTEDYCAPNLSDPAVIDAVQFMHDLVYEYEVSPAPGSIADTVLQFIDGDIAMFGAGRWPLRALYEEGFDKFNVAPWPGNPDQTQIYGVDGFGIFRTSQNVDAAAEFLKYMTSPEVQELLVASDDNTPLGNIPARRSVADLLSQFPPERYDLFYGVLNGDVELVPAPPRFNEMESIYIRYFNSVMADEMGAEEAMNAAQAEMESVVSC